MLNRVLRAAFEHVHEADQIAVVVGVEQQVAHVGLGNQNHAFETFAGEQRDHCRPVGDGHLDEAEIALPRRVGQAGALETDVVVVVMVIDTDGRVSAAKESQRGVHTDEIGGAGKEAFQVCRLHESGL